MEQTNQTEEEEEYREAIRINENDIDAHNCLGLLLYDLGRYNESEQEHRKAIEIDPTRPCAHACLGQLLFTVWRFEEAAKEEDIANTLYKKISNKIR
ncbi:TPA_asm: hp [Altiarchaeum virus]|nr:TPA_asm: hp [Altiarchaeum virus]